MGRRKKAQPAPWYQQIMDRSIPKKRWLRNGLTAFCSGGLLCVAAQAGEMWLFPGLLGDVAARRSAVLICVIGLAALLTGLGWYDKLGQKLGAGLAVPISGFANSVAAAMLEHKSEGLVLGTGCNSFKLAGAVVVFGVAASFFAALLAWIIGAV